MGSTESVSIIIPAYNARATIQKTLRSIAAQSLPNIEIVVVVDGPCEETVAAIVASGVPGVKTLVNEVNRGGQYSRNRGLAQATGRSVMFVDSDDYLGPDVLQGLVDARVSAGSDIAFAPWRYEKDGKLQSVLSRHYDGPDDLYFRWLANLHFVPPVGILWSHEALKSVGGWHEGIKRNQDGELILRAVGNGKTFCSSVVGWSVYVKADNGQSVSSRADNLHQMMVTAEHLLLIDSPAISPALKTDAIARHFYNCANISYRSGADSVGDAALRRSRELGFEGHLGSFGQRAISAALGLKTMAKIGTIKEQVRRSLKGQTAKSPSAAPQPSALNTGSLFEPTSDREAV